jgi:hypothetical protein
MSITATATDRPALRGVWLLPAAAAVTLWATFEHQPDVSTQFGDWARFVTTDKFLANHLIGSIVGQAVWILGAAALALVAVANGGRVLSAIGGLVAMTLGSAGLIAGFGVAAFAQPAIGHLELAGVAGAHDLYDDVYGIPTLVTLIGGGALFAVATVLLARAAAAIDGVPRWATVAFGAAGPLIGFLGIALGAAQTVGSVAALAGGIAIARSVHQHRSTHAAPIEATVETGAHDLGA